MKTLSSLLNYPSSKVMLKSDTYIVSEELY